MTIFVSIASYRDPELLKTISSLIDNADNPDDLRIGIVSQDLKGKHPDFSHDSRVRQINIHARDAKGAGYARKVAMTLYEGEDFFFQIDSHMRFAQGWDTKLIGMYDWCSEKEGHHKIILSQFPAGYFVGSDGQDYFIEDDKVIRHEPTWTMPYNRSDGAWGGKRMPIEDYSVPHKSWTVLAGYLFAHGSLVSEVPYDDRISFMGEELCFAIRAYTRGWEIYAPNEMLAWHFYTRKEMPKVWADGVRKRSWMDVERDSYAVQKAVLLAEEKGVYGVEDYDRFFEFQDNIDFYFHDFYYSDQVSFKTNMSLRITEIDFSDVGPRTGYCINGLHEACEDRDCTCYCHKEE